MNYSFKYVSVDNYILKYTDKEGKDKELPFTRTVEIATKLQGIVAKARLKMFKELSSQGFTKNDLIVKVINKDKDKNKLKQFFMKSVGFFKLFFL